MFLVVSDLIHNAVRQIHSGNYTPSFNHIFQFCRQFGTVIRWVQRANHRARHLSVKTAIRSCNKLVILMFILRQKFNVCTVQPNNQFVATAYIAVFTNSLKQMRDSHAALKVSKSKIFMHSFLMPTFLFDTITRHVL